MLECEKSGFISKLTSDIQPFADFPSAASAVLQGLRERFPFDTWVITRAEGVSGTIIVVEGTGYGLAVGQRFQWDDSCCKRMILDLGPRIAPSVAAEPAYAAAPACQCIPIGAYIGVPISAGDGKVYGTLCAINPTPVSPDVTRHLRLIENQARLISSLLAANLRADKARQDATTDEMTGLLNRRGWDLVVRAEEARCKRYGSQACIVAIDLDELKIVNDSEGHAAGDDLICRAARALKSAARTTDALARVGGDEFALLAIETDSDGVVSLVQRIRTALAAADVLASLGVAPREAQRTLEHAWEDADAIMYTHKRKRKNSGVVTTPPGRGIAVPLG